MTLYEPGDVVLVAFPFTSGPGSKVRPALVILDTGDLDVVVTRITTQSASSPFDVALADWRGAGLLAPSSLRLHKLATLAKADIQRKLGRLQATDRQTVTAGSRRIVDAW